MNVQANRSEAVANAYVRADARLSAGDRQAERVIANLDALGGQAPSASGKPRVKVCADGSYRVTFPHGGQAEICPHADGGWVVWSLDGRTSARGHCSTIESAMREASTLTFEPDAFDVWGSESDVHALALACDDDRTLFTKTIKRIARERFGAKLSARGSRGTGYGWVYVKPAKEDDIGALAVAEELCSRGLIRPCGGERVAVICDLAGHPLPDGFEVRPPQWD